MITFTPFQPRPPQPHRLQAFVAKLVTDNPDFATDALLVVAEAYEEAAGAWRIAAAMHRGNAEHLIGLAAQQEACERIAGKLRALAPWFAPGTLAPVHVPPLSTP